MTTAYFDCTYGVSERLILEALMDAGLPASHLRLQLRKGRLSADCQKRALRIIKNVLTAEGKKYGQKNASDLWRSVASPLIGFEFFNFDTVVVSPIPMVRGSKEKGPFILMKGLPVETRAKSEAQVTSLGIAILKEVATHFGESPLHSIQSVAQGTEGPYRLTLLMGEGKPMLVFETHIDDMNPQWFDFALEQLWGLGVVDVTLEPLQMKKNRPGTKLTVIAAYDLKDKVCEIILRETTSVGVRYYPVERKILQRQLKIVRTRWGKVTVKIATDGKNIYKVMPEYETCKKLALQKKIPLAKIYRAIYAKSHS